MVVAVAMDPLVEEEAEGLVNPRPSTQRFSSLAARTAEHDRLFKAGLYANRDGDVGLALAHFTVAYSLLFKRATLLALVNMLLKKGDCELAVACYRKMVASESVTPAERVRLMTKLHEAVVQWAALREVVEASQAGLLNSQEEREKRASKLMEKAHAANEARDFAAAEALFLEAWRLTFRKTTLISAANMMARQEARYRLAAGIYFWMRRRELTDDERMMVERKLKEVQVSLSVYWNRDGAARTVQRLFRGKHGRLLAVVQKKSQEAKQAYPARSPPSGCSSATSHSARGLSRFWPGRSTAPNVASHWSDDEEMGTGGAPNQKKPSLQESSDDEELATDAPRRNERTRHEPPLPLLLPRKSTGDSSSRSAGESFVTANPERVLRARKANEQKRMGGEEDPPSPPARHHTDGAASPERPAIPASQSGSTPGAKPHEAAIKSVSAPRATPASASSHHPQRDLSEKGKLKVHLVRGSGLLAADKNGFSDPYVVAKLGKATKKSKVIKKTLNPEWNETLEFGGVSLGDLIETSLSLHVWDYDGMTSRADDMGEVTVGLAWLAQEDAYEATERLNTKGRLEFRLSWEAIDGRTSKSEGGMARQSSRQSEPARTQAAVLSPSDGRVNTAVPSSGGGRSHAAVASSPVARDDLMAPAGAASSQQSVQQSPSAARLSERGSLKVHLVRGSGLLAADKNGFSDPYVVAKLGKATKKSKVIKKTLNPEWNETLEFGGVSLGDLIETSLSLHVWDYDGMTSRADDMGEVTVSLAWLAQEDAYEATERLNTKGMLEFRLSWEAIDGRTSKSEGGMARQSSRQSEPARTQAAVLSPSDGRVNTAVPSSGGGRSHAAVASSPVARDDLMAPAGAASSQQSVQQSPSAARLSERGSLKVHLVRGSGLLAADKNGFSDPYVVAKLGKATKKSKVIKKTLNPEWNETLEFGGVSLGDLIETSLSLHVWDYDGMTSRADDMGEVTVSLAWLAQEDAYEATERLNTKGMLEFRLSWEAIDGRTSKSEGGMSRQSSRQSEPARTQAAVFLPAVGRVNAAVPSSGDGRSHAAVASSPVARDDLMAPAGAASSQQSVQQSPSAARLSERGSLKVHLVRGSGLMAADKNGFSDPYVVAKLGKATKKSKVIKKTLNPEWNETFEFGGVSLGDLIETSLSLHVWDYDGMMSRADDMGEVNVSLAWLAQEDAFEATERLNTKGRLEFQLLWIQAPSATLGRLSSVPVLSSERPSTLSSNRLDRLGEHGSLLVHLARGSELLAADKNGLSDPYVVAKLGKVTHKSKVIKKTLDPVWNETLVFDRQTLGSLLTSSMELHVYDKDGLMSFDDSLGKVLVPLETLRNSDREEISTYLSTKGRLQFTLEWLPTQIGSDSKSSGLRRKLFQVSSRGGSRYLVPSNCAISLCLPNH
ncbi:hypothetical protein AB1Y20_022541 [Prymnesium parvum]|uniref:C2 domain-containing protein n=1 Tax=Prymnesium parvum TaxID=97485 RepID=A0AB34JHH2_PRYPA